MPRDVTRPGSRVPIASGLQPFQDSLRKAATKCDAYAPLVLWAAALCPNIALTLAYEGTGHPKLLCYIQLLRYNMICTP